MFKNATFLSFYYADNQFFINSETLVINCKHIFIEGNASKLIFTKLICRSKTLGRKRCQEDSGDPSTSNFDVFNIGTGKGYSVLEVIAAFEAVTGKKVPHVIGPRRSGDIVSVWAETTKVKNVLGWSATRNLETMIRDAWNWQLVNGK